MKPFYFVHLTDPQFGFFTQNADFALESLLLERSIEQINRLRPAFVAITGDFVHDLGNDAQVAACRRILNRLDPEISTYTVPGNHDVGNVPTSESLARYRADFGPDRFWFRHEGCWFIGINSGFLYDPQGAPNEAEDQSLWLHDVLSTARAAEPEHIVIFMHHPLCVSSIDEPDLYFNIPHSRRRACLDAFYRYDVRVVFSGHYHRNALCRYDGMDLVTTGAVGRPLGEDPPGFRVVKVCSERIEHAYYGLGEVPESIEMTGC